VPFPLQEGILEKVSVNRSHRSSEAVAVADIIFSLATTGFLAIVLFEDSSSVNALRVGVLALVLVSFAVAYAGRPPLLPDSTQIMRKASWARNALHPRNPESWTLLALIFAGVVLFISAVSGVVGVILSWVSIVLYGGSSVWRVIRNHRLRNGGKDR
jgi:hypothetical protein